MHSRKDGDHTRAKILEAACEVFAQRGYREATHAEICTRAGVNIAAINYHFGSKSRLYRAAWDHAREQAQRLYPLDGGVSEKCPPADRLRGVVGSLVRRRADTKRLGHLHRIRTCELSDPTGLLDDLISAHIKTTRSHISRIIRDLLGENASPTDVELCEISVVSQCLFRPFGFHTPQPPSHHLPYFQTPEMAIDHITRFCLAGIEATRSATAAHAPHTTQSLPTPLPMKAGK